MKPGKTGLARIYDAARYSKQGFLFAWANESAFRQEVTLLLILVPLAFVVGDTGVERALLIASCLLVVIVELLNSSIEATVDRIGSDHHDLSGAAKDLGSAAVLVACALVVVVWLFILLG